MSLPIQNPTHECNRCGFIGPERLFLRKDEAGEYITDKRYKTMSIYDKQLLWRLEESGMDTKSKQEYIAAHSYYPEVYFCPKCDYVNGMDPDVESAWMNRAVAREELNRAKMLRDYNTSKGSGCVLLVVLIMSAVVTAYGVMGS